MVSIWSPSDSVSEIRNQQAKRRVGQNAYKMTTVGASRFLCLPGFPESLVPFKFAADSKLRLLETTINPKPLKTTQRPGSPSQSILGGSRWVGSRMRCSCRGEKLCRNSYKAILISISLLIWILILFSPIHYQHGIDSV